MDKLFNLLSKKKIIIINVINKIEDSKIVLNQINAGTTAQFDVEIEPIESEQFDLGLLTSKTKIKAKSMLTKSKYFIVNMITTFVCNEIN